MADRAGRHVEDDERERPRPRPRLRRHDGDEENRYRRDRSGFQREMSMRYLSMIRVDEKSGQKPSERLMNEISKLMEEAIRDGWLVTTAGLRPTAEGKRMRWNRGKLST